MQQGSHAILEATGEPVIIMGQALGSGKNQRYPVQLPPQQSWHKPRHQEIRGARLRLRNV